MTKLRAVSRIVLTALLIGMLTLAFGTQAVAAVDWWPMFRHDLNHTGYSTSTASSTNNVLWSYTAGFGGVASSPAVADGKGYIRSMDGNVYAFSHAPGKYAILVAPWRKKSRGRIQAQHPQNEIDFAGQWLD